MECLESVLKLQYENFQIIVVDNSEAAEPFENLTNWAIGNLEVKESLFENLVFPLEQKPIDFCTISENEFLEKELNPKIVFVKANQNKGFAAGNNIALRYIQQCNKTTNPFIWVLNNDTVVVKNALSNQIKCFNSKENIGILGSKLIYYNDPGKIQAIGGSFNNTFYITQHICEGEPVYHEISENLKIDYVIGASMFMNLDFINEVGLMDENFFLYFEETDWAFRAKAKDYNVGVCLNAIVYHKEGKSIGSSYDFKNRSFFSEKILFISRKRFIKKHFKLSFKFYFSSLLLLSNRIRRGQFKIAFELLKITFLKQMV
jgi:hypothetical protein